MSVLPQTSSVTVKDGIVSFFCNGMPICTRQFPADQPVILAQQADVHMRGKCTTGVVVITKTEVFVYDTNGSLRMIGDIPAGIVTSAQRQSLVIFDYRLWYGPKMGSMMRQPCIELRKCEGW